MEEYNKINWKKHMLKGVDVYMEDEHMENSHINDLYRFGKKKIVEYRDDTEDIDSDSETIPGAQYMFKSKVSSTLDINEHFRLICALKAITSGVKKRDFVLRSDIEFYNSMKQTIVEENAKFLKNAEIVYYKTIAKKPICINTAVYNYAKAKRLIKLKSVFQLPQYYKEADLFSYSYSDDEAPIDMVHTENVHDLGTVSKFYKPLRNYPHIFSIKALPNMTDNDYNSKRPISEDANIESMLCNRDVDIVLSLSSIKRLINFTETNQTWHMPVIIKDVKTVVNGKEFIKKVVHIDKPLPKLFINKVDLLETCSKLFVRTNFCQNVGFAYPHQEEVLSIPEPIVPEAKATECETNISPDEESSTSEDSNAITDLDDDFPDIDEFDPLTRNKINHNVAYKMWRIEPKIENIRMKNTLPNHGLNVLIRSKIDACEKLPDKTLQPLTVVPKIEFQLCYGGQICTKAELANQWTSLFFKPRSNLYRIRHHYYSLEVVKCESFNISQVTNEATQYYNFKPQLGLGVMYKIFSGLKILSPGKYLLKHEPKNGPFVVALKEHNDPVDFPRCYNLHRTYGLEAKINDIFTKPWIPIDVNVLLPIFEHNHHMPGMFPPKNPPIANQNIQKWGKKRKKKKGNYFKGAGKGKQNASTSKKQ